MNYPRSEKYLTADLMSKIMGPNPIKLEEKLLWSRRRAPFCWQKRACEKTILIQTERYLC